MPSKWLGHRRELDNNKPMNCSGGTYSKRLFSAGGPNLPSGNVRHGSGASRTALYV